MKINAVDVIDSALITMGVSVSLTDIHQILSIILLIFNAIWIIVKVIVKCFKYYNNDGKLDDAEVDDIMKDLDKFKKDGD